MKLPFVAYPLLLFLACRCATSNPEEDYKPGPEDQGLATVRKAFAHDVTVLGNKDGRDLQVDVAKNGTASIHRDLFTELGIPSGNIFFKANPPFLSYYSKFPPGPSLWEKDLNTSEIASRVAFCPILEGEQPQVMASSSQFYVCLTAVGGYSGLNGYDYETMIYDK